MHDISEIYEYSQRVLKDGSRTGAYESDKKKLKSHIRRELSAYKKQASICSKRFAAPKSKLFWVIPAVIVIAAAATIIFVVKLKKTAAPDTPSNDNSIPSAQPSDSYTENASAINIVDTTETKSTMPESTETASDSAEMTEQSETPPESIAESYNGYSIGEIVYYSGTVHYVSSFTNQLSGACTGGRAMISGINPDGLHKFHLVAADDNCTVYGWVDEAFIKHID